MIDLYGALRPLDAITGQTTADDILSSSSAVSALGNRNLSDAAGCSVISTCKDQIRDSGHECG